MIRTSKWLTVAILAACAGASTGWAQATKSVVALPPEEPDARRTREELSRLLERHPPELRGVLALDPALLSNQAYLTPYPALVNFLNAHPEIARNPSYFVGQGLGQRFPRDREAQILEMYHNVLEGLAVFTGFGLAIGLLVWLIRTFADYRRWSRLVKVQTDVHTKLLDRFTANDELIAYVQSPAGSKFLQSAPIKLEAGSRSVGAPLGRILWSVQGGLVLVAGGIGLLVVSSRIGAEVSNPVHALGILAIALGLGFVISAVISYFISRRLGLIEPKETAES